MNLGVTVRADEKELVQLGPNRKPGSGVPFGADPEDFLSLAVMEAQCFNAPSIPAQLTATSLVRHGKLLELPTPLRDVKLRLARRAAKGALSSAESLPAPMPVTPSGNSRLL